MIEGTNPQVGKVTVDEFAAAIKEKYPEYKDIGNLKLAKAVIEKYPEYKDAVTFEPVAVEPAAAEPVKKKDGFTPSASSVGQSQLPAEPSNTFFQPVYDTADWLNKNIPVWSNWASVSTQMAGGMTTAVDGLVKEGVLFAMPEGQEKDDLKKKISETGIDSVIDTPLEGVANMMRDYGQEVKQQRQENYGISIEQQQLGVIGNFMNGDFISSSKLAIDGMTDGMIQAGLASLTGIAPLAVSAGGEKYYDVSNKPNYSSSERVVYSSAVGLAEGLIESVFSGDIKAFSKVLDSDLALKGFQEQLLKAARDTPWYKEFLKMGTEEGLEETLSESFGQMLLGVKEGVRPDATALGEAFISGFLPGGGTHIVTNGISAIGSEKRTKRRQQLGKQIKDIEDKIATVEDPSQKAILEEMIKGDIDELSKEIELDAELYADFSDEDVKETIKINTDIRKLYQKIGLAVSDEQKEAYKKEILKARSRKLEIENRYSEEPVRYIRDGKLVPKAQFIDMINKATPEEMSTGQWGVENDTEAEQLLASRMPQEKSVDAPVVEAPVVEAPVAEETKVAKSEEEIKQEKLEQDVVDIQAKIDNLREEDGSIPEDKSQEFKDLTAAKKNATNRAKRGNSQSTVIIKKQKETGGNFEILDGEEKSFAIAVISKIIASSKTAEEALQKIFSRGYNIDADTLGLYLNDKLDSSAPQVGNNKDSFEAWVQGKSDAELSALKGSAEGTPAVETAVAKEPVVKKVDTEAIGIEENTIADAEFRIEDLQSDIDIEKGNIKEAKDKAKEDIAAARKSKLPKEEKAEKIEEIKAELQDTVDDINGNIENNKEDISGYKSDIRKANKRLVKLKAVPSVKAKEQLSKETKTEELEIVLLDEQGGRKKLTQTALSDPRNIQKGKMTVEYSDKGLTFKTESDTGRMKENGGELFVSNKEIESIPNINKYEKGTKEYAFQIAEVIGVADQYKGDPIKLMKDSFVKAQDIGKEGTPSAKRFTPAQGAKLAKMVDNFNRIIKRIGVSPVKIVFVNSPAEFKQYYEYTTGSKKETLSKASYLPLQKEIIVDLSKADMTTLAHEMLHAYVSAIKLDRKKITLFTGIIEAELLKGSDAEVKLANELAAFRDEYIKQGVYGKGRTKNDAIIAEEFLAEYVGIMSAYSDNLSPAKQVSFIDKIRAAVVKFLAKIGVVDKSLTVKIQNREDALNFINGFVDALGGRIDITTDTERSAVVNSKNPYEASRLQLDTPVGSRIANKPLKDSRSIAISYMESKGLSHIDGDLITNINEDRAKRISDAYVAMKNDPKNPEVAAAYKAMAEETLEQYEAILKGGYNIEVNNNEPYNNSNELIEDLRKNKNMRIFSTDSGFGDEGITAEQRKDNPLLSETKYKDINGRTLLVNDVFRFVHDFFGHAERGNGFGPIGEENAWDVHSRMYSPLARKALTAETRGQNSYVNFSGVNDEAFKLRDKGRELRKEGKFEEAQKFTDKAYATMKFAPQKVGLLADEFVANPYLKQDSQESEPIAREQIDAVNIISADTPKQKAKKEAVAEVLNGFAESQLAPNSSEQDLVSRFLNNIFEESLYTLKKGPRESGMTWYIEDITEFENKMTVLLPELSDPNQMKLFKQILAITSSGTNPNQNLQTAYTLWIRSNGSAVNFAKNWGNDKTSFITNKGVPLGTGVIVSELKTKYVVQKVDALGNLEFFKNGQPKLFEVKKSTLKEGFPKPAGFTARGSIVAQQLSKIEQVYKDVDGDIEKLIEFFEKPQPVSELRKYNKGLPDVDGNTRKIAVGKRNGAFIFGEKIGAFYQNMIGIGDTITMDLWWSRTWNRYMGTMLSTVDNKQVIQETPRTDRERDIMRKSVTLAANKLGLDVSELQAVIWYFEQELWTKAGNVSPSFSYVTAVESLSNKITTDEQIQKRFSEAGADLTAAEKRRQDAISRANNIIAEGGIQGDVARDQIDWQPSLFGKGQVNLAIVNRATPVQEAAINLLQGKITNSEYQETVRITQPIEAITKFFLPASTKDMKESIDRKKGQLLNAPLKDGQPVGLRLDIPAYKNKNIWVVSVHDKGSSGKSLSYGSVAWATNVQFGSKPKVASFIAAGKNMDTLEKQDKDTIARMLGEWKNFEGKTKEEKDASAVEKVNEIVKIENSYPGAGRKGSPWRQIGMNPFRHSFFYDRRTGKPVIAAAEVVQIGGLVYAKDVVYADKNDPIFNVEGYKDANGETVRFQLEDQQENENNNKETYSAVEDNQEGLFDAGVDELVDMEVSNTDSWKERPRTTFEKFIDLTRLKIQDSFRKVIRVQEDVEYSSGKPVGLDQDFRNAEALMHGKAKEELNKTDKKVADIAAKISASGLSVEQFNELLYAMHAQERNRFLRVISTDVGASLIAMRKKLGIKPSEIAELLGISTQEYNDIEANKKELKTDVLSDILLIYGTTPSRFFYDNAKVKEGSGMTDVEARKILASYDLNLASPDVSQLSTKVRVAVESVRSLMQDTRDVLLESGLETQSTIDAFEAAYKNYVPLRGFADSDVDSEMLEGGRKLEVRGREKRAKGRSTKADSPLTQIIVSNTTNIVRGEKNRVMNKFYNLAVNNPNKDVYQVVDPKITKEYKRDLRNGKIVTTAKTISDYLLDPNMISVRVDGDYKFIRFKDASLAEALRGANVAKAQWMVKYIGAFNRTLSSFITTYDPEFILRNFSRDIQTAVLNLYAEQEMTAGLIKDKNIVANVIKDTFPALRSILAVEGGISGKKKESDNKEMDQYYREFKEDGARTEWFYSKSSEEVQKDIEKLISGKKDTALQAAGNLVERINSSVENAVRLSSYVNARKAGVSRAKSAELAKNLTVNFNKSGEWGQIANTLFLFFNASVQGVSRLARTLKPNYITDREGNRTLRITTAQKMAVGLMLLGSIMSLLNEGLSDDDEDDGKSFYSKIPDFEKERNFIIMKPNGKDYFKIPLPYGVNVFYVTGTLIADASQKIKTPGEVAGGIMQAALGSFSPINFPNSDDTINFFEKFITPTIGQVPLALAINENYFGQTIYNENFPFDASPKPDSELGKKSGNRWTKELTKFLNKVSGGSEFRSGEIDINPDKIDFVMESYSGGMGKFVGRSANVVDKVITGNLDQLEARQIPGVRVFYGQVSKYANFQEFYTRSTLVNQMQEEVKNKIILGPEAKRVSKIFYLGKNTRKKLSNLKKREDFVMKIKDPEVQKVKMEKLEKLRYKLVADYNKQYEKFEIDKIK